MSPIGGYGTETPIGVSESREHASMDDRIIARKLDILRSRTVLDRQSLGPWEYRIGDNIAPGQYRWDHDWRTAPEHVDVPALKTVQLRTTAGLPESSVDPDVRPALAVTFGDLEGLITVDGRPWAGLDANHPQCPPPAPGTHAIEIEAIALPRAWRRPELRNRRGRFQSAAVVHIDRVIEACVFDLDFAWQAIRAVRDERRRGRIAAAIEEAMLMIDVTLPADALRHDARTAAGHLRKRLTEIATDPEAGRLHLAGHTHIDTAWLWPVRETVRKCARTFSTAVRLMENYPDFHFSCSQAQLYEFVRDYYPDLYRDIRRWIEAGRWHTTGAMWVETDCNAPSGESLIRQIMYGLEFFSREFGTRPRTCWLPDVFGYPGSLPQILKGCGLEYFFTCKLHWQSTNPFPYHLFWWEGVDGSRVLAHIPRLAGYYNGFPRPDQLMTAWENFHEKAVHDELLLPFGYGDGGGGPTSEMLEFAARAVAFPGLPAARIGGEEEFFDRVIASGPDLPVWQGELYLETHRGTFTSQARTKQANRRSELLLREAEIWASLAQMAGLDADASPLRDAWKRVLLQQFHDILPGSSIGEVYKDAAADFAVAQDAAVRVRDDAARRIAESAGLTGDVVVFNPLSHDRTDPFSVILPAGDDAPFHFRNARGDRCPVQIVGNAGDTVEVLVEPGAVPAFGAASFRREPGESSPDDAPNAAPNALENAFFRIELDREGRITRLWDKRVQREVIGPDSPGNDWQIFQDGPEREAAWNVHDTFEKRRYPFDAPAEIRLVETGPIRAAVRIERPFRSSYLRCDIRIYRNMPRIDFAMEVDWQERHAMLKVAFPVLVRSPHATFEIQFGALERPTHRNTSWEQQKFEVPAQRWADLSEDAYGVSLLNDCKYGYDVKNNVLRLTLLRGPDYPDPEADRGTHRFTYSLLPHPGSWQDGGAVQAAAELNCPMSGFAPDAADAADVEPGEFCGLRLRGRGVIAETLKPAENGDGWILRVYEAFGGRTRARIEFGFPIHSLVPCNFVEEDGGPPVAVKDNAFEFDIAPFQVRTFRLRS